MNNTVALWNSFEPVEITDNGSLPLVDFVPYSIRLSERDQKQIAQAISVGSFEMATEFIWNKTIRSLKRDLGKLGLRFISEMLGRDDIQDSAKIEDVLSDYDALRLAEDLGFVSSTGAFRLKRALETVSHFSSLSSTEQTEAAMEIDEAAFVIKSCIKNILARPELESAGLPDFVNFRERLVRQPISGEDVIVDTIKSSPYFMIRTTINALISEIRTSEGSRLEIVLGNTATILPVIWDVIAVPEKWSIGKLYAELVAEGKQVASAGVRKTLLKTKGFDFVPETLRSNTFIKASKALVDAHEGFNNFYNEPEHARYLSKLGTIIPAPAIKDCMSAMLCVYLGNPYGRSSNAVSIVSEILSNVTADRWDLYFSEYLPYDDKILNKFLDDRIARRFRLLVDEFSLAKIDFAKEDSRLLVQASLNNDLIVIGRIAARMLNKLGYKHN